MNRIGNLIVPNDNYCKFEEWLMPILDKMVEEQKDGTEWTPSKFIHRLGKEINDESVSHTMKFRQFSRLEIEYYLINNVYLEHILLVLEK